jgi:hypothetical protein
MLCRQCPVYINFIHFACPTAFIPELPVSQPCNDELFKPKRKSFILSPGPYPQKALQAAYFKWFEIISNAI